MPVELDCWRTPGWDVGALSFAAALMSASLLQIFLIGAEAVHIQRG
jgi:hypothetical protein